MSLKSRKSPVVCTAVTSLGIVGAILFTAAPSSADPPNCTAADLAGVAAGVSAATSAYLFTHPDFNEFVTGLKGQPRDGVRDQVQQYLDAHPQTRAEIQAIRQPLRDIRDRCGVDDIPTL